MPATQFATFKARPAYIAIWDICDQLDDIRKGLNEADAIDGYSLHENDYSVDTLVHLLQAADTVLTEVANKLQKIPK